MLRLNRAAKTFARLPHHKLSDTGILERQDMQAMIAASPQDFFDELGETITLLAQEVRLGYWLHVEFTWTNAVRTACELAEEHSLGMVVRAMDLFHVAIATEIAAERFLSFDDDQNALAEAAGLTLLGPRG